MTGEGAVRAVRPPGLAPERCPEVWASDWGEDRFGLWQAFTYKGVRQAFRWIPPMPEPFLMGSPEDEQAHQPGERQHPVRLPRGFWIAETACTQGLWRAMTGEVPSHFNGDEKPVERVSWQDVQGLIGRLNGLLDAEVERVRSLRRDIVGAQGSPQRPRQDASLLLRLPTEAEWEYACRAGSPGPFVFGDDISPELANYDGRFPYRGGAEGLYRGETVDVALLPPNPWGLYEMHGNLWEWCQDWYGEYPEGLVVDPEGPLSGVVRVCRGGGWGDAAGLYRSAQRFHRKPSDRVDSLGFRLALGPELRWAGPGGQAGSVA